MASASGMTLAQFATLLNATRDDFIPDKIAMTLNYPRYEVGNTILPKYKKTGSGENYTSNIQLEDSPNGGAVGMFFVQDVTNLYDTDHKVTTAWKHYTNNCSWDEAQLSVNKGNRVKEYDYLKSQKMAMWRKVFDDLQEQWWSAPTTSSDTNKIFSPPCWLTNGSDGDTGGFGATSGYYLDGNTFNPGGIDAAAYSKWASYYADHNGNVNETLLDMLCDACLETDFEAPLPTGVKIEDVQENVPSRVQFYTTKNVIKQIEKIARNSDDRIGYDLGKYRGKTTYKGIQFNYVKLLDTASAYLWGTDPIYAVNYDVLYPVILDDWYFKTKTGVHPFSHNAFTEFVDLYWAVHCTDRRGAGFLISQYTAA